ncbi:hydroxymethylglutaryl-CoA lyase [Echinicola vietnamensis]|uniref:Isopropylmalate/homocitrate/citramalate synthase n=1 Tax=Echinicola vietnamensis (strain DSM 17526 / LMG 23754 / KMM 6221) TaxID=926556 RepID=L0G3I2_ECHVK|nr:hydroxymethylglutaryl-CoA lyase [Echinicola vietnamensis]AGA80067.1 isopropylmalate/homocitrate/citramalate synthase [Echinicola vietnamensis DSM 17526]
MKIIECPRDAMQGREVFIDTAIKAAYINQLLNVGFDTVDFGSFVSPKAMPQMRDTAEVLDLLDLFHSKSKLLAIVANVRGAEDAMQFEEIDYLGFPLSISETFQQRNTNKSIQEALEVVANLQNMCEVKGRTLVTYLSMGFGNPYGEPFSADLVAEFVGKLDELGVKVIALSDTIGAADPALIEEVFKTNTQAYPEIEFGGHFHSRAEHIAEKVEAGLRGGCRRFDGAINGFGGCPMAKDELVGNVATEALIEVLEKNGYDLGMNQEEFGEAMKLAKFVFQ